MKTKSSKRIRDIIYYVFVISLGFTMLYPVLWLVSSSLKPEPEIFGNAVSLIPSEIDWMNYVEGWAGFGGIGFGTYFRNTFIIVGIVVIGTLLTGSVVAYGFARLEFRGKAILFACLMATLMLPIQVTLIPQYIVFNNIGWVNTFYPLIIPAFVGGQPFFIFLMIQFIRGIPKELDEAAIVDGATKMQIFWKIILPLLKPALVTVAIFSFMWTWDDFMGPLIYLNNASLHTVSLALRNFMDATGSTNWGPLLAMSTLSIIPQIVLFLIFQKQIVGGIATTGLK
ncbi:carbohydrate ABC transporter permease [Alkalibacterium iburiense]|uniref:Carbohydrate ABC transporter permease n=1 Tax=Alkalibacterium iburiense TaxID=290589 RepID=A0ABN0XFG1_9LACT